MKLLSSKEKEVLFNSNQLLLPFLIDLTSAQPDQFSDRNSQKEITVEPSLTKEKDHDASN